MTAVIVAGFHRSGTSMATELLARGGLHIGDDLIGANPSNPYGHFEDHEVVRLHDRMLADVDLTWHIDEPFIPVIRGERWSEMSRIVDSRQARHRQWGFKDPRVCFYLSAWKYLVPSMKTVIVYRDPRQCVWSLERRHLRDIHREAGPIELHRLFWERPDHGLRMWVCYNRALLDFAVAHRDETLTLPHAAIVSGLPLVGSVNQALGLDLAAVDNREVLDPAVMHGRAGRQSVAQQETIDDVLATWRDLEALAAEDATRYEQVSHAV